MSKITHPSRFFIDRTQFATLERALSIALPAAKLLGSNANIFCMRGSIFTATLRALIGLIHTNVQVQCDGESDGTSQCIAISQFVAKRVLLELKTKRAHYLEKIGFAFTREDIFIDHDPNSRRRFFLLRSQLPWFPCMTPHERYKLLTANQPRFDCIIDANKMRAKLQDSNGFGYVVLEDFPNTSRVLVGRAHLLAFLEATKNETTAIRIVYYDIQQCIVCCAGNVIAILSTIG
jgi:hypothetical protein